MPETKIGLDQVDVPAPLWYRKMTNAIILCFIPVYIIFINMLHMNDYTRSILAQVGNCLPVVLKGFAMILGNGQRYVPSNKTIENMKVIIFIVGMSIIESLLK